MAVDLKVGSKAIIVNSEHHSQYNFHICEIVEIDIKRQWCFVKITETNFTFTMWVGFNELIPILYDKKEDIEKYGDLEHLYKLFSEYKGYYDCICKLADGEMNRSDKLAKENQNLQCKIDEMQKHIDCMKAEIEEKEDKPVLSHEPIKVAEMLIGNFTDVSVDYMYSAMNNCVSYSEETFNELHRQEVKLLRQIAEHLLVYCNAEVN